MPNPNAPFGFKPTRHMAGGTPGRTNAYPIASAYGTSIYRGDPVAVDGSGNIVKASNSAYIIGVFAGVQYTGPDGVPEFSPMWAAGTTPPANTKVEALVWDDPMQVFLVQSTGTLAATAVGKLANVDVSGGGTASTGLSKAGITGVAGTENQFLVQRLVTTVVPDGTNGTPVESAPGQYAIAEVSIAKGAIPSASVAPASTEY